MTVNISTYSILHINSPSHLVKFEQDARLSLIVSVVLLLLAHLTKSVDVEPTHLLFIAVRLLQVSTVLEVLSLLLVMLILWDRMRIRYMTIHIVATSISKHCPKPRHRNSCY